MVGRIKNFVSEHIILSVSIVIILVISFFVVSVINTRKAEEERIKQEEYTAQLMAEAQGGSEDSDNILIQMQQELENVYGTAPEGFIWETDGTVLSLGDKSMSAEEVVYAYFRGLATLDLSTVERYSRDSVVVDTYRGYFDDKNKNTDYMDKFLRNMYKECLLSLEIDKGIENRAVFAENKNVFTVSVNMLDLTNKDFWKKDKMDIYNSLYLYESDESDSAKSDTYLYEYILDYYKSGSAKTRKASFDITVQKYPDLDSGWLVSIDADIDDACRYKDGKLVASYIKDSYRNEGRDLIMSNSKKN